MENFGKTIFVIIVMIICFLILFSAEEVFTTKLKNGRGMVLV